MVPNLLPFSASVTTGGGSTQSAAAVPQGLPGFAAMLGLGTTPVAQGPAGGTMPGIAPVTVTLIPPAAKPLLGLTGGKGVQPLETALPELLSIADPVESLTDAIPEPVSVPVLPVIAPAPAPAPVATLTKAPAPVPETEGGTVTVVEGGRKSAAPLSVTDAVTVTVVDRPDKPAPLVKPVPAPEGDGGTVTIVDGPDKPIERVPEGPVLTVVAPIFKPAEPAPATGSEGGSVTIVEPVRSVSTPKTAPVLADVSVTVVDGLRKSVERAPETPISPVDAAPVAEPVDVAPVDVAPALTEVIADPLATADGEAAPAPLAPPVATAAPILLTPAPAPVSPAPIQPQAIPATAPAPIASRVAEPARSADPSPTDIAPDAPVDDGAFDNLVTSETAPDTDALRTSSDTASDAMNRDGNRQSAPQQPAAAPAPTSAAPIPAFDPLASAAAPDAARAANDPAAEPRARASAIGEDVGLAIVRHADSGSGDVLVIRLDPAELGKIEVRLRMDEARQLSAEVTADQPATLDLLRRDSDNLTRALNDAGFRADDQSLRFDSRGFGQSDQQAQQGRRIASRAYLPEDDAAASSIPTPVQVRSSGRVDLVA
ncbi:flagellar hook-length control protein FliK [Sphingomonas sp. R647]|uniref:flagellar hook-length control protein FliK n=1 Tax=Sphingomonas sp. R647 TaxID=2875233 RepID=UPI001CD7E1F5|nr:flagellar hook-length control protein FliK [Sphingomonas sp. R647]MCA1199038.1 flagellar hook-length control protein FliK [Sphingomonas sp. R647]